MPENFSKAPTADKPAPETSDDVYEFKRDYSDDLDAHDSYIKDFDAYEAMVISKTYDSISRQVKSGITDGSTTTLYLERAARVVGQLPSGVVQAAGKKDKGKGALMDIIRQKWIYPNANAQHPFLMKLRMWQFGSSVYGFMPMFYDWHVSKSGYIGPDCWLWSPRNFIPQNGRTSIQDMDYVHAISYVGEKTLEGFLDEEDEAGWKKGNVRQLIDKVKNATKDKDSERDTFTDRQRSTQTSKQIALATRYEAGKDGRWITFAPDYGHLVLRDIKNPHKSGKIPFVIKYAIPLYDNFYGLGDFQRSKPVQFAKDGLTNFYFEGIKMNIYPPTVINANGVVKSTVDMRPGAVWQETIGNSVRRLETSTAGLSTYQAAQGQLSGALQSLAGTTDTRINAEAAMDPGFGKTPEALRQLQARESTRDNEDRTLLEMALEELIDGMLSLIPNVATENIPIDIFADEIQEIFQAGYEDIADMIEENESGQSGKITIKPKELKGVNYRFNLTPGTTAKADKAEQKQALVDYLGVISKFPNAMEYMRAQGKEIDWEFISLTYGELGDVPGLDKIWKDAPPPEPPQPQQPQGPQGALAPMSVGGYQFNDPELAAQAQMLQGGVGGQVNA